MLAMTGIDTASFALRTSSPYSCRSKMLACS
jgi:hypothetical protein